MAKTMTGYCVRCREEREMNDTERVEMPSGKSGGSRPAMKGICAICGTSMFKILKKK